MMGTMETLEQFAMAAEGASGDECASVVYQAMDAPGVYVFSELLQLPSVQALGNSHAGHLELLKIFAYGAMTDYKARAGALPELTRNQHLKLQYLTIVSLATKNKDIPYALLMGELGIGSVRELEDVIIGGIYADVFHASLDPQQLWVVYFNSPLTYTQEQKLHIEYTIGRDVRPDQLDDMINTLTRDATQQALLAALQERILSADQSAQAKVSARADIEAIVKSVQDDLAAKEKSGELKLSTRAAMLGSSMEEVDDRRRGTKQIRHARK